MKIEYQNIEIKVLKRKNIYGDDEMVMKSNLDNLKLEEKLYLYILISLVIISTISFIGNMIIGLNDSANYKWIFLIMISLIGFILLLQKRFIIQSQSVIASLIIFIFLPNGWIDAGGLNNLTIAYIFLICISLCFVFTDKLRIFFIVSEILVLISLIIFEIRYPHILSQYPKQTILLDMFIQIPLTLFLSAYIVIVFSNAFRVEREKLKEYSKLLKDNNKKLLEISRIDELTGAYNRRYIFEILHKLKDRLKEDDVLLAMIIMIDIDNFKFINDHCGHIAGDDLLKKVSSSIISIIHSKGIVGRYGGDEFIIVLENVNEEEAKEIVEKIKIEINKIKIKDQDGISVSGGMVQFEKDNDIDNILSYADQLLYKVKQSTKNNIIYEFDLRRMS